MLSGSAGCIALQWKRAALSPAAPMVAKAASLDDALKQIDEMLFRDAAS